MLRSKYLFKKLVPASSLQYNLSAKSLNTKFVCVTNSTKFYSTSFQKLDKKPTEHGETPINDEPSAKPVEETLQENKTATQIDIRSSQTGMVEGSRINHYLKKKEIGMTDDESTVKGKVVAKSKDLTAFIFAGGAAIALGYALYVLYKEYFSKKPEDYAYDNAAKCVQNHPVLENNLGVNFTVSMSDKSGRRNFGSKVEHEPAQKFPDMGDHVELMTVQLYANTNTRKCVIMALMVKNEEEAPSEYVPLLIYGITDYDKKHYARKVVLIDYRAQMKEGIDLIRQAHEGYLEKVSSASEIKFERSTEKKSDDNKIGGSGQTSGASVDSISLFGDMGGKSSGNSSSGSKNFADDLNKNQEDSNKNSEETVRLRPKF